MRASDHLRTIKIGNGIKYNLREVFTEIHARSPDRKEYRRFKRFLLKHVEPFWYVSKVGRKYAYFNESQMSEEVKCHIRPSSGWMRLLVEVFE